MTRAVVGSSNDHAAVTLFQTVLTELGGVADDNWHDPNRVRAAPIPVRPRRGDGVCRAWAVDVAGSDQWVNDILAGLTGRAH